MADLTDPTPLFYDRSIRHCAFAIVTRPCFPFVIGPQDVAVPRVSGVQSSSLRLTWEPPARPNGIITNYNIYQNEVLAYNVRA